MENVAIKKCLKGRGGNDVQHKNWKGKILRIWITIIGHGVSESALHQSFDSRSQFFIFQLIFFSFLGIPRLQLAGSSCSIFAVNLILYFKKGTSLNEARKEMFSKKNKTLQNITLTQVNVVIHFSTRKITDMKI